MRLAIRSMKMQAHASRGGAAVTSQHVGCMVCSAVHSWRAAEYMDVRKASVVVASFNELERSFLMGCRGATCLLQGITEHCGRVGCSFRKAKNITAPKQEAFNEASQRPSTSRQTYRQKAPGLLNSLRYGSKRACMRAGARGQRVAELGSEALTGACKCWRASSNGRAKRLVRKALLCSW